MSVDISTLALKVESNEVATGSARLDQLTKSGAAAEASTQKLTSSISKMSGYLAAAASAFAAWKLSEYIKDATLLAARAETLGIVMRVVGNNAGYTTSQMDAAEKQVRKMGIATIEARESLTKMAGAQMDVNKASQLARVAQDAAVIGNINSSEAFGRMIQGIRSGEVEILKTIGINVQFDQAYKATAASLGKTTEALTAQEKVQARMNSVLSYGINIQGAYDAAMGTAGKQIASLKRYYDDLKIAFGEAFAPALAVMVEGLTEALKGLTGWFSQNKSALSELAQNLKDIAIAVRHPIDAFTGFVMKPWESDEAREQRATNAANDAGYAKMMADQAEKRRIAAGVAARTAQEAEDRKVVAVKAAAQSAKDADRQYESYSSTMDRFNSQIRESNPYLSDHQKKLAAVDEEVRKAVELTPQYEKSLRSAGDAVKQNINFSHDLTAAIAATSAEFQGYLDMWANQPTQGNQAGEMNLRWEEELRLLASLQPSAGIDALNTQIATFERLLSDIPGKGAEVAAALTKIKADFAASSGLDALNQGNTQIETSLMDNQYQREMQQIQDRYDFERTQQEKALALAEKDADKRAAIEKRLSLLKREYTLDSAEVADKSYRSQADAAAQYTGYASQAFTLLASTQNEASRSGFESAKAYSIAAAVMNTAAGIMSAFASLPWPAAPIAAALVAATGVVQIAKISSTSFGGSGSVSAPAGSFSAGSGGSSSGAAAGPAYTSVADSQSLEAMQRLAESTDNASIAMRQVADGLTTFAGMLSGDSAQMALGGINGKYTTLNPDGSANAAYQKNVLSAGGNYLGTNALGTVEALRNVLFGTGKWTTTGSGVQLGIEGGELDGQGYTTTTKKGGMFKSTKTRTDYDALNSGFADVLSNAIASITSQVNLGTAILGTSNGISGVNVPKSDISTAGRSQEDIQKDVESWLEKVGNEFAKTVTGLGDFAKEGEGAYAALMRLSTALQGANYYFGLIGKTLFDSDLTGANQSSKLVELMGGSESFSEKMEAYFTGGMFTEAQQDAALAAQATLQVTAAFREMGVTIPGSRDEFIALVNSIDATTGPGASLVSSLMDVQAAFVVTTKAADEAAKKMQDTFLDTALAAANALRDILGGDLSTLSPEEKYRAQGKAFADAQAAGRTTELPELGKALLAASRDYNASGGGYTQDYAMVTRTLADLAAMPSTADLTLTAAQSQVQLLTDIKKALDDGNTINLAALTKQLATGNPLNPTPITPVDSGNASYSIQYEDISNAVSKIKDFFSFPKFANGGITSGPSIAGEAGYPEAVVPLPNGRSIPVDLRYAAADNRETVAELKEQNRQLKEQNTHLAALVRVSQAGLGRLVEQGEQGNKSLAVVESGVRLAGAA